MSDLVKIKQYRTLAANVEFLEGSACTITKAYGLLKNMQLDDDPCAIKDYINKRLSNSDLETIINCTNLTIDPTSYALLQKAQPTSAAVERSFSMLNSNAIFVFVFLYLYFVFAIATQFLYYTLIDTGTHNGLLS